MKFKLLEDINDVHVYVDSETGNQYYYDGTKLVPINNHNSNFGIGKPKLTDIDKAIRKKEAEDRAAEIKQRIKDGQNLETAEERDSRIKEISKIFTDPDTKEATKRESSIKKEKDTAKKARKAANQYKVTDGGNIEAFKRSLKDFIKKSVAPQFERTNTFKKFNPTYQGTSFIKPGHAKNRKNSPVPKINVYFDRSRSWGPEKSRIGMNAIACLNEFVKDGLIEIYLYYFNDSIMDEDPGYGYGGTEGAPVARHIIKTHPDNVIIMTDSDTTRDNIPEVTVPGGVWFLFVGGESVNMMKSIKGRKLARKFDL